MSEINRRLQLVRQFEVASARQRECGVFIREFTFANLPLLAESYERECRELAPLIIGALEELTAMDKSAKVVR